VRPDQPAAYRVLARSYRPRRLSELIGQEALVRTLTNAFTGGRLAHAFLLCGIRGIGKTTTARIIAAGLNCTGADGRGGATPEPCGACPSCVAIAEGRSLDVIEQDAASNTGKDDIIELLEGIAYLPVASRYKVFILDEVHMLSDKAWAALLKTVEEPPPHVKFVFATTELRKVPVTVLSRCQRFELRRVDHALIAEHLARIAGKECVEAEPAALALIARTAGGSVRDALSLLDQAIALGEGRVALGPVREMLGLADRSRLLPLMAASMRAAPGEALDRFAELLALGADPLAVLQDLLELAHRLARLKAGDVAAAADPTLDPRAPDLARELSMGALTRAWQMLLRGLADVEHAPDAAAAAEMVLLRLATAAELPPPAELFRVMHGLGEAPAPAPTGAPPPAEPAMPPGPASAAAPRSFRELVELLRQGGEQLLAAWLHEGAHLVHFEPGRIEFRPAAGLPPDLASRLGGALKELTGRRWLVAVVREGGAPTLAAEAAAEKAERLAELERDPRVRAVLDLYPGARIVDVAPAEPPAENAPDHPSRMSRA
jgi:DNA polymerase-3 subunit gamma/tau